MTDKIKCRFFQAAVVSILLYGHSTWTLSKHSEKKIDSYYTRTQRAILIKSWRQHPTKQQLQDRLPPITKTKQVRRTGHAGHCWRSKDELISDILLWTHLHGRAKTGRPARTYTQQLCADTGYSLEDLPGAMDDKDGWRNKVRKIRACGATWWWWWVVEDKLVLLIYTTLSIEGCQMWTSEPAFLPYYLPIAGARIIGFIPFPRVLVLCEM